MNNSSALINTEALNTAIINADSHLLIIDLSSEENYAAGHIPGAIHIKPSQLSCGVKPAPGKLPELATLQKLMQSIGLSADKKVVVYDDAGGSWAGRMIWTLTLIGHDHAQLLDGGRAAWEKAQLPLSSETVAVKASAIQISINSDYIADMDYIRDNLHNQNTKIWDARSQGEYDGTKVLAQRGGHIPGAVHLEWTELSDDRGLLLDNDTLQELLNSKGLNADKEIITHCQTHRRSGLTWFVANKLLGYDSIKAYPGSWSEWGNTPDTPIAMESHKANN